MDKRGQEEIVGFVIIVLIVSVVILIFLGIFIHRSGNQPPQQSRDVYQFLESSMVVTTSCAVEYAPAYDSLSDLIKDCSNGRECISGKSACVVLNKTLRNILNASWQVGPDRKIKGYNFTSVWDNQSRTIISINEGVCNESIRGAEYLSPQVSGTISDTLRLCFKA